MSKFMLSMVLGLASLTGLAHAVEASSPANPAETVMGASEFAQPHWKLMGTFSDLASARRYEGNLQDLGYTTSITAGGGNYYVYAWVN